MKKISEDLSSNNLKRVYLVCGDEDYLKLQIKSGFIKHVTGGDDMNTSMYEGKKPEVGELMDIVVSAPFFAERKLVVIENSGLFKSGGEPYVDVIDSIPDSTVLLFIERECDKRSKLYKAVSKAGYVCSANAMKEEELAVWAAKRLAGAGKKITKANMSLFLGYVGNDMLLISNELEKLICHSEGSEITPDDIEAVTTKRLSVRIFDLIDAISLKNRQLAVSSYRQLIDDREPAMRILFMLTRQFNLMLQADDYAKRGIPKQEMASKMGVQGFIVDKTLRAVRKFTTTELKRAYADCVRLDESIKRGEIADELGVEMLVIKYSE